MKKYRMILVFILSVSLVFLCACSQQKKPTPQKEATQQDEDKPPKELEELKESIEKMQKQLESIHEENSKPLITEEKENQSGQQNDKGSSQSGQDQQNQEQSQGQGQQGQQGQNKTQEQNLTPQQEQKKKEEEAKIKRDQENIKKFESLKKDVLELHSLWNNYEPKAVIAYAQPQMISGFEMALNNLTQIISKNDDYSALLSSIELSKYLSDFYSLYKTDVPPELDKYRFAVKKVKLLSEKENFDGAATTYKYLEDTWGTSKPKLPKEVNTIMNKFEFALKDLKNAINSKSKNIVNAKCEMFIKLIDELEKSIEEAKQKEEQK